MPVPNSIPLVGSIGSVEDALAYSGYGQTTQNTQFVKSDENPDELVRNVNTAGNRKITEDDEEATPDKGVAKRGNKLDRAIKDLRAVEKNIKTHLAMFKDAEGVKAKEAAMNMLKKDNDIKKELTSLIKRLEGDVIK